VKDRRTAGRNRHGAPRPDGEDRAVAGADTVRAHARLIEDLEADVDRRGGKAGTDDVRLDRVALDDPGHEGDRLRRMPVTEGRERRVGDAGAGGRDQAERDRQAEERRE